MISFHIRLRTSGLAAVFIISTIFFVSCSTDTQPVRILVFTKTTGFRHIDAIEVGVPALQLLGKQNGYEVDTTENAGLFTEDNLQRYRAVIFLQVSGEVFTAEQRTAFQRYIQAGGGFVGVHAPADAERSWPWYGRMIGAYFRSHPDNPNVQKGTYQLTSKSSVLLDSLPERFEREDEFYDFDMMNPEVQILVTIDENTYQGGKTGDNHPAVWYHNFDGGRSFYTAMGHTPESYKDPFFLRILSDGIGYAMGNGKQLDYSRSVPEESRFTKKVLMEKLDEPMHMAIAENGTIYFAQRRGEVIAYNQDKLTSQIVGRIAVNAKYEDGLLGIVLDPGFADNRRLYVYYTAPDAKSFRVSRFELNKKGEISLQTEKILLSIPKDILDGSHTGGGLIFDAKGNLYIATGDNSSPREWKYSPIDQRKGRAHWDAQRSSANTNDLRGKILRIHPEPDGTYTIPDGNLFAKGTMQTRPEIYTMGHRQPWRIAIDSKTGWLYVGEVGPDANNDSSGIGPKGYDEFNQIRGPGNFGWPQFIANNKPYWQYDFETKKGLDTFSVQKPLNTSVNNTGIKELPPAQKAFIWYPYGNSKEFPLMGSGGRSATGGPVFRKTDFKKAKHAFPDYYEGKWFIAEWIRGWINVVSMDEQGNYRSMERFMPGYTFSNPIDLQFGPDGSLYMLEYGKGWFRQNDDARLVRIEYNGGNRVPVAVAGADKKAGPVPLQVQFSSAGSKDYDGDALNFQWEVLSEKKVVERSAYSNPSFTLKEKGVYDAVLTVSDKRGATATSRLQIIAGYSVPSITTDIVKGNQTFFFPGSTIEYQVRTDSGQDAMAKTRLDIRYIPGKSTNASADPDPSKPIEPANEISLYGGMVLNSSDCYSCHAINAQSAGPSFTAIAERYRGSTTAIPTLAERVIKGSSGQWGHAAMSAHPDMDPAKAKEMITFILSLSKPASPALPLSGTYQFSLPAGTGKAAQGVFVIKAIYTDSSKPDLPPLYTENNIVLRSPEVIPASAPLATDIMRVKVAGAVPEAVAMYGQQPSIGFRQFDLTDIKALELDISPAFGAELVISTGSPGGTIIGKVSLAPGPGSFSAGKAIRIPIAPVNSKQDIFITGHNDKAKRSNILFILTGLRFLNNNDL